MSIQSVPGDSKLQDSKPMSETFDAVEKGDVSYRNRAGKVIDITTVQPGTDTAYELKIVLLNQAMLDLGMGKYQWTLFVLTGFGCSEMHTNIKLTQ
ncbi:hypothetical protein LOCC1_G004900 [Lachnellula occidentalis]|uniref:Uncharacterized protein n=1 Tax=Lachnellula occidentalis TaxID=215460 RepID=A0A8H8RVR9_9HELO|nr:hypothetical protein LOCC1_G004900 [Lachnellula occidentalis]